jgi:hypothetical protein
MNRAPVKIIKKESLRSPSNGNETVEKTDKLPVATKEKIIDNITHWVEELHKRKSDEEIQTHNLLFQGAR